MDLVDEVKLLNKTGVQQMHAGALQEAQATLQLALSQCVLDDAEADASPTAAAAAEGGAKIEDAVAPKSIRRLELVRARSAALNNLGSLFKRINRLDQAVGHLQAARDLETKELGVVTVSTLLNLGAVLLAMGSVSEAVSVANTAVERAANANPEEPYLLVLALHNLAVAQQSSTRHEDRRRSTGTMLQALRIAAETLGPEHQTTVMLRVKCGIPPGYPAQARPSSIAPRAPTDPRPAAVSSRRSDVDAARQALRQLDFATPEERDEGMVAAAPSGSAARPAATTTPPPSTVNAEDVMDGAVFTDARGDSDDPLSNEKTFRSSVLSTIPVAVAAPSTVAAAPVVAVPPTSRGSALSSVAEQTPLGTTPATTTGVPTVAVADGDNSRAAQGSIVPRSSSSVSAAETVTTASSSPSPMGHETRHSVLPSPRTAVSAERDSQPAGAPITAATGSMKSVTHYGAHAPHPSSAGSPSVSSSNASATPVLRLKLNAASVDKPPSFMRYSPHELMTPPSSLTFKQIREDLRQERAQRERAALERARTSAVLTTTTEGTAAVTSVGGKGVVDGRKPVAASAVVSAAERKRLRQLQEEREERLLREQLRREDQLRRMEEAKQARADQLRAEHLHRCARTIQRLYRKWWLTTGFSRAIQRKQQEAERARQQQQQQQVASQSSGGKRTRRSMAETSRAVVRCAKIWLRKTAGRRLIVRLGTTKKTGWKHIEMLVKRVQRLWRLALARMRVEQRRLHQRAVLQSVRQVERKHLAARIIQRNARQWLARRAVNARRRQVYGGHAVVLQRWYRRVVSFRARAGALAKRANSRGLAATTIQRVWRGYLGRLAAVMRKLKVKVEGMKRREFRIAQTIQRAARGYQARRTFASRWAQRQAEQHSHLDAQQSAPLATLLIEQQKNFASVNPSSFRNNNNTAPAEVEKYHRDALVRVAVVGQLRERERNEHHLPLAADGPAQRERELFAQRQRPLDVLRMRAAEDYERSLELSALQRMRAARVIQRTYRQWKRLAVAGTRKAIPYATKYYARRVEELKLQARLQQGERQRLREMNDLGRDVRELRQAAEAELFAAEPPKCTPQVVRSQDARVTAAQTVKAAEERLAAQTAADKASLRALPTFLTHKEQRRKLQQNASVARSQADAAPPATESSATADNEHAAGVSVLSVEPQGDNSRDNETNAR